LKPILPSELSFLFSVVANSKLEEIILATYIILRETRAIKIITWSYKGVNQCFQIIESCKRVRLSFLLEVQVIYKQMHLLDLRKAISVFILQS
jgi:hypothetical protein